MYPESPALQWVDTYWPFVVLFLFVFANWLWLDLRRGHLPKFARLLGYLDNPQRQTEINAMIEPMLTRMQSQEAVVSASDNLDRVMSDLDSTIRQTLPQFELEELEPLSRIEVEVLSALCDCTQREVLTRYASVARMATRGENRTTKDRLIDSIQQRIGNRETHERLLRELDPAHYRTWLQYQEGRRTFNEYEFNWYYDQLRPSSPMTIKPEHCVPTPRERRLARLRSPSRKCDHG